MIIVIALLGTVMLSLINIGGFQPVSGLSGYYICINEVMPLNKSVLADKDGNFHDWVEFYNAGDESICLKGYGLSDDLSEPGKWIFPDIVISPKSYLVIFASGKDYVDGDEYHTNFRIDADGEALVLSNPQGVLSKKLKFRPVMPIFLIAVIMQTPQTGLYRLTPHQGIPITRKAQLILKQHAGLPFLM